MTWIMLVLAGVMTMTVPMKAQELMHVRNSFEFTVRAPLTIAAPLFGAQGERDWAGQDWDPQFLWPQPAKDTRGAVFTIAHHGVKSIWANTIYDPVRGHFHYVCFVPEAMVTQVDVHLSSLGAGNTRVQVVYERTALSQATNAHVQDLGRQDAASGPRWETAINECLAARERNLQ